jgi:SAM-dependent methyltransferase
MQIAFQRRPLGLQCSNSPRSDHKTRNQRSAAKRLHSIKQSHNENRNSISMSARRSLLATPLLWCGCGLCRGATAVTDAPSTSAFTSPSPGGGSSRNAFLDRVFAENMYTGMKEYEEAIAPVKAKLFSRLRPAGVVSPSPSPSSSTSLYVVEIGCGTGPNLQYYPRDQYQNLSITAVDPNNYMLPFLAWTAGTAEALPLEDSSADVVVCTLVLCSVIDVEKAVQEAKRVLRPGGQFLFIEHTVAQPSASLLFKLSQRVFNPLQRALADGCNLTRDPLPVIESAGFRNVESMRFAVEGMGLIAPHVAGIATA